MYFFFYAQEAYTVLKNLNASEVLNSGNSSRDECINGLLNSTEEEYLKFFEREYQLSTKILLVCTFFSIDLSWQKCYTNCA